MSEIILKINNLNLKFGAFYALKDINFQLEKGQTVSIIGPNGAGKSSLIKSIMGLINITSGEILAFGQTN